MGMIERSFSQLGSRKLNQYLSVSTRNSITAIITGAIATAIVQSSSLVGLIVLALASSKILKLKQAIAIIIGANLGTTMTGWMVTFLGFKLNLGSFAIYIIGLSALTHVFVNKRTKLKQVTNIIISIGFIFFSLDLIKESVESLQYSFDINLLKNQALITYLLVGMVLSAIIQSSSAVMVMTLSAMSASIIGIEGAAALAIGADLGTTSTVALGSIKGASVKRKLAFAHFSFNLITNIFAFLVLLPLLPWVLEQLNISDPLFSLVFFHSFFNFMGIMLFLPWLDKFTFLMTRFFVSADDSIENRLKYFPATITELALQRMQDEICLFVKKVHQQNLQVLEFRSETYTDYAEFKKLESVFIHYSQRLLAKTLSEKQLFQIEELLAAVRHSIYSAKSLKDIVADFDDYELKKVLLDTRGNNQLATSKLYFSSAISKLSNNASKIDLAYLETWREDINDSYNRTHNKFTHQLQLTNDMSFELRSTLLNINKEIFTACKYSLKGLESLFKVQKR